MKRACVALSSRFRPRKSGQFFIVIDNFFFLIPEISPKAEQYVNSLLSSKFEIYASHLSWYGWIDLRASFGTDPNKQFAPSRSTQSLELVLTEPTHLCG